MKYFAFLLFGIFTTLSLFSQTYSKVRVFADALEIKSLIDKGVPLDHGKRKIGVFIETDLSESEIEILEDEGISYEVVIRDVQEFYKTRNENASERSNRSTCGTAPWEQYDTPENFFLGDMGGFFTYQQFLDQLDSMASKYPNLITTRQPISTFQTHEGRSLYHLQISDNPGVDEGEPQVLYTSIHHAREPGSLSQLIFYMWHLLENYDTDPEIQFLVDNTDMHFVPMINPDGYIHNETTDPNGGGMHRKNKRNVGTSNPGVDLNRNYDYQWGVSGVSNDPNDDTYPGTGGFSEPETQAIKWLCENNNFLYAANAHTYSDLLLYPFGYDDNAIAPDEAYFQAYTDEMVKQNNYANIKSSDLYPAAGDSDDWMYDGDLGTKPKIYALTPEIGYAFWPAVNDIIDICKKNIYSNMIMAHLPHNYGTLEDLNPNQITETNDYFKFETQRLGLNAGGYTVSLIPLQGIATVGSSVGFPAINLMDNETDSVSYTLDGNINFGDEIKYIWQTDFGTWVRNDTITKTFGLPQIQFSDNGDDMAEWSSFSWDITTEDFFSSSTSFTDSPFGNYSNNSTTEILLNDSYDLSGAINPIAKFYAKWEIEAGYDYVQFMISTNGGASWTPLCGQYTKEGSQDQDEGQPLYDGFQTDWVEETIDLSDYVGQTVEFKFKLESDVWVNEDGYYFDDFKILFNTDSGVGIEENSTNGLKIYPNPTNGNVFVNIPQEIQNGQLYIYDMIGKKVYEKELNTKQSSLSIDLNHLSKGTYQVVLNENQLNYRTKLVVQ